MRHFRTAVYLSLLGLAACGHRPDDSEPAANGTSASNQGLATAVMANDTFAPGASNDTAPATEAAALASPTKLVSCAVDIGAQRADRLVKLCRNVSPATHPPCNVANSCAMMEDEIARSCALFDGKGAPMPGCTQPKGAQAAAAVVQLYYSALNAHDYATAWQQWGENGPPGHPLETFEAGFAHTRSTRVTIGTLGPSEGAAGSIYQTVPVTVDATLDDGTHQRFTGDYVVRRVNGVDGASPDQLRWHIGSARLKVQ